jgi:hypothetical protein
MTVTEDPTTEAMLALVRQRLRRRERQDLLLVIMPILAVLAIVAVTMWALIHQTERETLQQRPAITWPSGQHLPPCDDGAPGAPVTGPCWLTDDGGTAIWPYPYASEPVAILEPSQ